MTPEVADLVQLFQKILQSYSVIEKRPFITPTGQPIYLSEVQMVAVIGEHPGINLTQIADHLGVTRGAVSQMLRKLIQKKLVSGSKEKNKKEINLFLTAFGKIVEERYQEKMKDIFLFAESLYQSATESERDLARRLFEAIHNNLRKRIDDAMA